jgi:hypothetical protein
LFDSVFVPAYKWISGAIFIGESSDGLGMIPRVAQPTLTARGDDIQHLVSRFTGGDIGHLSPPTDLSLSNELSFRDISQVTGADKFSI